MSYTNSSIPNTPGLTISDLLFKNPFVTRWQVSWNEFRSLCLAWGEIFQNGGAAKW